MEKNLFDQTIKDDQRTYDYVRKIATGQGDDYTMGCMFISKIIIK